MTAVRDARARVMQGRNAGYVSRAIADGVDFVVVQVIFFAILAFVGVAQYLIIRDHSLELWQPSRGLTLLMQFWLLVLYLSIGWTGGQRTVGKGVMGLRVLHRNGTDLHFLRAVARAIVCVVAPWVLLWSIVNRRNHGLHDILVRTLVIYDWSHDPNVVVVAPPPEEQEA